MLTEPNSESVRRFTHDGPFKLSEILEALLYFGEGKHKGKIFETWNRATVTPDKALRRTAILLCSIAGCQQ
jgi:hypothetical protein